ncbi:translation initiation factor IF-2-like [Oenanthe melanoleuca]|uniref:translation initiation factor IF-2-like n=1 Tax=Oenanthe melanoleuca TaxID=2939378 RepID=UPI0024C103E5|nr:translation initiation factor IF-2-like [Oenanthe melanoleuca]
MASGSTGWKQQHGQQPLVLPSRTPRALTAPFRAPHRLNPTARLPLALAGAGQSRAAPARPTRARHRVTRALAAPNQSPAAAGGGGALRNGRSGEIGTKRGGGAGGGGRGAGAPDWPAAAGAGAPPSSVRRCGRAEPAHAQLGAALSAVAVRDAGPVWFGPRCPAARLLSRQRESDAFVLLNKRRVDFKMMLFPGCRIAATSTRLLAPGNTFKEKQLMHGLGVQAMSLEGGR